MTATLGANINVFLPHRGQRRNSTAIVDSAAGGDTFARRSFRLVAMR
jgi:hypothetical protein